MPFFLTKKMPIQNSIQEMEKLYNLLRYIKVHDMYLTER